MDQICGGWSETLVATEETQRICDQVKKSTGQNYHVFEAVLYREQVVAGMNYLIKVHVGEKNYIHLSLFQQLSCYGGGIELRGVEQHETKEDPLEPFTN